MLRWMKIASGLAALIALPFLYGGVRGFMSKDPFGYFNQKWADPFGGDVGSVMQDVRATVYERGQKKAEFGVDQIDIRRDKQVLDMLGLKNGTVFEKGVAQASFDAERAKYNASEELLTILGGAHVKGKDYDLTAPAAKVDLGKKRVVLQQGIKGTALGGQFAAKSAEMQYGIGKHTALDVEWRGKPNVEGLTQVRDVQIRAARTVFTADPNVTIFYDAEAIDENALMRGKKITIDHAKDVITLEGGGEYYGPEAILSAPSVVVYRKQKKAVATGATGGVYLLVKPEGEKGIPTISKQPAQPELPPGLSQPQDDTTDELRSAENLRKYPIVVTASKVEYTYAKGSKKAVVTGSPKAIQRLLAGSWRELTAPRAEYEEESEILSLFSSGEGKDVHMKNSAGDDFIARSVRVGTKPGKETLSGNGIEGVMKAREEDLPRTGGGG